MNSRMIGDSSNIDSSISTLSVSTGASRVGKGRGALVLKTECVAHGKFLMPGIQNECGTKTRHNSEVTALTRAMTRLGNNLDCSSRGEEEAR